MTHPTPPYVWITRPAHQGAALCKALQEMGFHTIHQPTIIIEPLPIKIETTPADTLYVVVTSANAVPSMIAAMRAASMVERPPPCLAVGPATAQCLADAGIPVMATAEPPYGSNALLALDVWENIPHQATIGVFTGENSAASLQNQLRYRGFTTTTYACYRRRCPTITLDTALTPIARQHMRALVCTSLDGLKNLIQIAGAAHHSWLVSIPLVVVSDAMADHAVSAGFHTILRAANATDAAIITKLKA